MSVDITASPASSASGPAASEVHLHPLARGVVDVSNSSAGTLIVMGQTVQLTASTNFSDRRACLTAATSPCTAIAGQSALSATAGTGSTAVPGTYVTVHGYLYSAVAGANIVATLVSVADAPSVASGAAYKAEGLITAVGSGSVSIGGLAVDLSSATCYGASGTTPCTAAFSVGQVVSAFGATAPALPATNFTASTARLRSALLVQTTGETIGVEGTVSNVTTAPAAFVVRGISVDASALTSGSLPALGDVVRVVGVVASGGTSITASSVIVLHASRSATYGLEGNLGSVAAGSATDTYVLTLLSQSIAVNANTRLADRSVRGGGSGGNTSANPFNITTFQSYLTASASQHLLVATQADASGNLTALSVTIAPAAAVSSISGVVDASPAPVNSSATGTPSTFSVHGLTVSADPAAITGVMHRPTPATVAAGDLVLVRGSFAASTLTVTAPATNVELVIDAGAPSGHDHDCF
jgi:hypothetical protein